MAVAVAMRVGVACGRGAVLICRIQVDYSYIIALFNTSIIFVRSAMVFVD